MFARQVISSGRKNMSRTAEGLNYSSWRIKPRPLCSLMMCCDDHLVFSEGVLEFKLWS